MFARQVIPSERMVNRYMNGIEKITERIAQDAQAEVTQVETQAKAQADAITAKYAAQAEAERQNLLATGKAKAEERMERLDSAAQMEAKKMLLAAKQEMLDKAFALALVKLTQLPEEEYVDLLAKLAAKSAATGKEQIILSQADRTRYGVKAATRANELLAKEGKTASLTLSETTRDIKGGLLLSDGAVEVNCAFETLVRLARNEVAQEVTKTLFD